jgi:hypothetical protein
MAKKDFSIKVKVDDVMYANISTSKDGYNSARMVVKQANEQYLSISCEWEGDAIPSFALDLMGFMKASKVETSGILPGKEDDYETYANRSK